MCIAFKSVEIISFSKRGRKRGGEGPKKKIKERRGDEIQVDAAKTNNRVCFEFVFDPTLNRFCFHLQFHLYCCQMKVLLLLVVMRCGALLFVESKIGNA